jgi:cob(I)alamin adenosyltransferase
MVRIDRVVTRGGDGGETSLGDGARVAKDDIRVEAYGTVDEANAAIGVLRLHTGGDAVADAILAVAQNDLFDIGADLCVPGAAGRVRKRGCPA